MPSEEMIVVGDRFEEFLTNRGTIPARALMQRLSAGPVTEHLAITIGQSLTADQLTALRGLVKRHAPNVSIGEGTMTGHVEQRLTHKRDMKNVMIGEVRRVDEHHFVSDLLIDERTEVLEDHLTGQHIPAIALLEAARQTWTAVTERFLLTTDTKVRFVIGSIHSTFHRFAFPLPTSIQYHLVGREESPVGTVFHCQVGFWQCEALVSQVESEYRAIPERLSAKQESLAARQAIANELARLAPRTAAVPV